jgi:hypothetical protein
MTLLGLVDPAHGTPPPRLEVQGGRGAQPRPGGSTNEASSNLGAKGTRRHPQDGPESASIRAAGHPDDVDLSNPGNFVQVGFPSNVVTRTVSPCEPG